MRWFAWFGPAGGLLWIVGGLLRLHPAASVTAGRVGAALLVVAAALLGFALLGLARRWGGARGRHCRQGLLVGLTGLALFAAANVLHTALATAPLAAPLFGLGPVLLCGGLILIGAGALAGSAETGWQALPLVLGLVGLFLPLGAGIAGAPGLVVWVVFGLGWGWLGAVLGGDAQAPAPRSGSREQAASATAVAGE